MMHLTLLKHGMHLIQVTILIVISLFYSMLQMYFLVLFLSTCRDFNTTVLEGAEYVPALGKCIVHVCVWVCVYLFTDIELLFCYRSYNRV